MRSLRVVWIGGGYIIRDLILLFRGKLKQWNWNPVHPARDPRGKNLKGAMGQGETPGRVSWVLGHFLTGRSQSASGFLNPGGKG
jgi:hypothetical protein